MLLPTIVLIVLSLIVAGSICQKLSDYALLSFSKADYFSHVRFFVSLNKTAGNKISDIKDREIVSASCDIKNETSASAPSLLSIIRHKSLCKPIRAGVAGLLSLIVIMTLSSCVHECPDFPATEICFINLAFDTDFSQKEYFHDNRSRSGTMPPSRSEREYGFMRYIIRAFPLINGEPTKTPTVEHIETRDISSGYDMSCELLLPPGEYRIMVWSDLYETEGDASFYLTEDFNEITLIGEHAPNNDYRDAFRGMTDITIESSISNHPDVKTTITMQRPLAKFEFVSNDLADFFKREMEIFLMNTRDDSTKGAPMEEPSDTRAPSLDDYTVVVHYIGYMPYIFNMFADKPTDSKTGVRFTSKLSQISDEEATMGFDYVFVNGSETSVTVQLELYNKDNEQIMKTGSISVPLKRNIHTVVRGSFLMMESTGGTGIDPEYNGDHNVYLR